MLCLYEFLRATLVELPVQLPYGSSENAGVPLAYMTNRSANRFSPAFSRDLPFLASTTVWSINRSLQPHSKSITVIALLARYSLPNCSSRLRTPRRRTMLKT